MWGWGPLLLRGEHLQLKKLSHFLTVILWVLGLPFQVSIPPIGLYMALLHALRYRTSVQLDFGQFSVVVVF